MATTSSLVSALTSERLSRRRVIDSRRNYNSFQCARHRRRDATGSLKSGERLDGTLKNLPKSRPSPARGDA